MYVCRKKRVLKSLVWCVAITVLMIIAGQLYAEEVFYGDESLVLQLSENISAEILPRVELISGVLSQTSWMEIRGPREGGNPYFQELQAFFEPYRNHKAVRLAEDLTKRGFTYDAPPRLMLRFSPLPELEPTYGYSEYLVKRAGKEKRLKKFRHALRDLAQQSAFLDFFRQRRDLLERCLRQTVKDFDAIRISEWMGEFYGWTGDEFHLVFAPAMFPGGGYGTSLITDKERLIFQFVRAREGGGELPVFPEGTELATLTLHEFSHSFVDPSIERYLHLFEELGLNAFYAPVKEMMTQQAYPAPLYFFNETLIRAITIIALSDLYGSEFGKARLQALIDEEEHNGFYVTRFSIEQIQDYRARRKDYPRFDDFVPELFARYAARKEILLARWKTIDSERWKRIEAFQQEFNRRMESDAQRYSQQEFSEINRLYKIGISHSDPQQRHVALQELLSSYPGSNRAGCAAINLSQRYEGEEREQFLKRAAADFRDCWYGNGVQVGAYALFLLINHYLDTGRQELAFKGLDSLVRDFDGAIDHQGRLLVKRIEATWNLDER